MKVLMTSDTVGGVRTYALELARALQQAQVEVVLATMGPKMSSAQARAAAAALWNLSICQSAWKLEWMENPWEDVAGDLSWPIYVAGDEQSPDGERTVARHTQALGRLDEKGMARWLGQAAIYCLPARYEPFGLSVLEAALAGCTLALGDISSLREIWGEAAIFVAPDDAAGLRTGADVADRK